MDCVAKRCLISSYVLFNTLYDALDDQEGDGDEAKEDDTGEAPAGEDGEKKRKRVSVTVIYLLSHE